MRLAVLGFGMAATVVCGCSHGSNAARATAPVSSVQTSPSPEKTTGATAGGYVGFDRNDYPGDVAMAAMRNTFAFTGYWLTNPPGDNSNSWHGKRALLRQQGWGFLVLANGRLDAEILKSQKQGKPPADLARTDASTAVAAARAEGFPAHTIVFLDQEEGGRLLEEQSAYLLAWTEAVAASEYRAGVYASGQPVPDGPGQTITTIDDIRSHLKAGHLQEVAMFDAQDSCPPAPGCTVQAKPLSASGEPNLTAWQYAQSPRRPEITRACAKTYATDGNCYAPGLPNTFLDMDLGANPDPSHAR